MLRGFDAAQPVEENIEQHRNNRRQKDAQLQEWMQHIGVWRKKLGATSGIMPKPTEIATTNRL